MPMKAVEGGRSAKGKSMKRFSRGYRGHCVARDLAVIVLFSLLGGCGVPGPGGAADSFGIDFSMPEQTPIQGAICFFVDGVNGKVFAAMLAQGELPAMQKYFVDRGLYVQRAAASMPSVTLANQTSIVTGRFPGHHGVIGINWFDRTQVLYRDYETIAQKNTLDGDYQAATIYEQFPNATTFSIFLQAHRGATKFFENRNSAGPAYFFGRYGLVDRISLYRLGEAMDIARAQGRFPAFTMVYLLSPDFTAYKRGVESWQYRQALRDTDRQIGRVLGDLERAGRLDDVVIGLVSDHSLMEVTRHFPLSKHLTQGIGIPVAKARLWERTDLAKRLAYYRKYPAVLAGSGCRYWALSLRKPIGAEGEPITYEPWPVRPSAADLQAYPTARGRVNLLDALVALDAVDVAAYSPGPNRARVRRAAGEVEFRQPGGPGTPISHHLISGADPLAWEGRVPAAMLDGTAHDGRQWLDATADTDYPDLPAQIVAYFRARRAGDIAVFAAPGWDFSRSLRAGHGGLRPGDMYSPMLLAGPGVPHRSLPVARTVDLMPTLLRLLDRPIPDQLDGMDLLKANRRISNPEFPISK